MTKSHKDQFQEMMKEAEKNEKAKNFSSTKKNTSNNILKKTDFSDMMMVMVILFS